VLDSRKHRRLATEIPVRWSVDAQGVGGDGVLLDISVTGARLASDATLASHRRMLPIRSESRVEDIVEPSTTNAGTTAVSCCWVTAFSLRGLTLPVYPIGGTLASCDRFGIPST